jgi:type II secretory pathway pseudopilin PulG
MKTNGFTPSSRGFTLIEILAVVGFLAVVVVTSTGLFFSILKVSNKVQVLNQVKQNGNYALTVMERSIRNAVGINNSAGDWVELVDPGGGQTRFACEEITVGSVTENAITTDGARLTSEGLSVTDCASVFLVESGMAGVNPDKVTIQFTLSQTGDPGRQEERAEVDFQTTVSLRNF